MNVYMTGATGYIGSAVAAALRKRGHEVVALIRSELRADYLKELRCYILERELRDLPELADTIEDFDVTIHIAQSSENTVEDDRAAVDTFTSIRPHFIYTSGVWVLGNTDNADESSPVNPLSRVAWRPAHEELVLAAGGAVIRPGCVYGGRQSLLADWFASAEENRPLKIVGDGGNHWAMVDLHELADLYVLAAEQRVAGMLHGIDDTRATLDECARAVAPNGTIAHQPLEEAREHLGWFADALAIDQRIDSSTTRSRAGWTPRKTFTNSISEQWQEWKQSRPAAG